MLPFGRGRPARVTRTYGRDSLLVWMNPLLSALEASIGLRVGLRSDVEVRDRMQKDADAMARKGYRVVEADEYALPVVGSRRGATYYQVTYELVEDEAAPGATSGRSHGTGR